MWNGWKRWEIPVLTEASGESLAKEGIQTEVRRKVILAGIFDEACIGNLPGEVGVVPGLLVESLGR